MRALLPEVMRLPAFRLYWLGVALSQIGTRATLATNLWQVQELTNSTLQVGFAGLFEALALLVLGPLGGALADRMERRRLFQATQIVTLAVALALAGLTYGGQIEAWHIFVGVLLMSAAATFDMPARQALIPGLVPEARLVDAFALVNPSRELAYLIGAPIAGILIALAGPGAAYLFTAATYAVLVLLLGLMIVDRAQPPTTEGSVWRSIVEGLGYVRSRKLIWQLMSLDFSATFFGAYRVVLPALARDFFAVGAAGYGFLSAAPAAGAIVGSAVIYSLRAFRRKGFVLLGATMTYAACVVAIGYAPVFALGLLAAAGVGFSDAVTTTLRMAVVQLETPDGLRGRVTSLYGMVARGGPSLGQAQMGALATALGPPLALTFGAAVPFLFAGWLAVAGRTIRDYQA